MAQRHKQVCDCNAAVVGSIVMVSNALLFRNIFISSLWHQVKNPRLVSAMQCEKFNGKWGTMYLNTRFFPPTRVILCEDDFFLLISSIKSCFEQDSNFHIRMKYIWGLLRSRSKPNVESDIYKTHSSRICSNAIPNVRRHIWEHTSDEVGL